MHQVIHKSMCFRLPWKQAAPTGEQVSLCYPPLEPLGSTVQEQDMPIMRMSCVLICDSLIIQRNSL